MNTKRLTDEELEQLAQRTQGVRVVDGWFQIGPTREHGGARSSISPAALASDKNALDIIGAALEALPSLLEEVRDAREAREAREARAPSDQDLKAEFLRVNGAVSRGSDRGFFVTFEAALHSKGVVDVITFDDFTSTDNRAAVYALLRALPDYDEDNKETET